MSTFTTPATSAAEPSPRWHVQLLGGISAIGAEERILNFSSRSVAALLARLALFPERLHPREELIELLWPGVNPAVGRNRLRQTLFTLRQLLEPPRPVVQPVLSIERDRLGVSPSALDCDVLRFEAAARRGDLAQAIRLYGGELLPGFYDEWIHVERLRLTALFERLTAEVSTACDVAGPGDHATMADRATPATEGLDHTRGPAAVLVAPVPPRRRQSEGTPTVGALPVYLTRWFGRDAEVADLVTTVRAHRLVTLFGPGGSGKTRLAVELALGLARVQAETRFDVIAFVPLVHARSREQLVDALHASLHRRHQGDDALEALKEALSDRNALLVLDNFEQLAGFGESVVAELTATLPGLHLVVTSRRVLGVDGERAIAVGPLALPAHGLNVGALAVNPAVALFVDRARAVRANFRIGPGNVTVVANIVRLLDGMPLAIELAAARVRSLAPAAMAELLREARSSSDGRTLQLLERTGPRAGLDPRHTSMRAVIEWSWRLLAAPEAELLSALTVFRGGFTAAAVTALQDRQAAALTLVQLDDLVAQSMVRVDTRPIDDDRPRFDLDEPIREYATLQLDAEHTARLRGKHRAWMVAWAAALPATPSLPAVQAELPNLAAALGSALEDEGPSAALRLVIPLGRVLEDVDVPAELLSLIEGAVDACREPRLQAEGRTLMAPLLFVAGRGDAARTQAERGLEGQPRGAPGRGRALHALARVRWRQLRDAAGVMTLLDEAEALAVAGKDDELLAGVHSLRGFVTTTTRPAAEGEALHAKALAIWQRLGNEHAIHVGHYNLAVCAQNAGRHGEALTRVDAVEASVRLLENHHRLSQLLNVRGNALCGLRRWNEAAASLREAINIAWAHLSLYDLAYGLWNLPRVLAHVREPETALQLAAFAATLWTTRFGPLGPADERFLQRVRRLAALQRDAAECARWWTAGLRLDLPGAVALALRTGD